jgi:hypothetical protein
MSRMKNLMYCCMLLIVLPAIFSGCRNSAGEEAEKDLVLTFNDRHQFKIAQFTDIHWKNNDKEECARTISVIRHVLETEQPDLVVLTGDLVNEPAGSGWKELMTVFTGAGVKFALTLGNHDDEAEWSRTQIFDYLESLPGFIGEKGPEDVTGTGNYTIRLAAADNGSTSAILWFFDSNAYCEDKSISDYGWIHHDQISWYREQSRRITSGNNGRPIPALAFFHIPLPEYNEVINQPGTIGEYQEEVCAPKINSGMFTAFYEMQDVKGTFVGHDHVNNYIGIHKGIALAYGQSTGGYGELEKGARIIELREGEPGFHTWVRTKAGASLHFSYNME